MERAIEAEPDFSPAARSRSHNQNTEYLTNPIPLKECVDKIAEAFEIEAGDHLPGDAPQSVQPVVVQIEVLALVQKRKL